MNKQIRFDHHAVVNAPIFTPGNPFLGEGCILQQGRANRHPTYLSTTQHDPIESFAVSPHDGNNPFKGSEKCPDNRYHRYESPDSQFLDPNSINCMATWRPVSLMKVFEKPEADQDTRPVADKIDEEIRKVCNKGRNVDLKDLNHTS